MFVPGFLEVFPEVFLEVFPELFLAMFLAMFPELFLEGVGAAPGPPFGFATPGAPAPDAFA